MAPCLLYCVFRSAPIAAHYLRSLRLRVPGHRGSVLSSVERAPGHNLDWSLYQPLTKKAALDILDQMI